MKNPYIDRNRESSEALKSQHRKYIKKPSPESSAIYIPSNDRNKSNQ